MASLQWERDTAERPRVTVWDVVRVVLYSAGYGVAMWVIVALGMGWN